MLPRLLCAAVSALAAASPGARFQPPVLPSPVSVSLSVNFSSPLFAVFDSYLSVNIDTGSLANDLDLRSPVLRALLRTLVRGAPTQLRVGGGAADDTYFTGAGGARGACSVPAHPDVSICVDTSLWDELADFCAATGARLVWDLNLALNRTSAEAPWYPDNSAALIAYAEASGSSPFAWQLGNEPQDYYKRNPPLNLTGARLAADYAMLRALLSEHAGVSQTIFGPDACCEERHVPAGGMLRNFSAAARGLGLGAITFHEYPLPRAENRSCVAAGYTNLTEIAAFLEAAISTYAGYAAPALSAGVPLVLGETATTALGGCDGLSNRFVAGFTFMFTLAAAATARVAQVNRQDLVGWSSATTPSAYALLGAPGWARGALAPHPDYFLAVLWKQLVGAAVLDAAAAPARDGFDARAWCAAGAAGGVVVAFVNARADATAVGVPARLAQLPRTEFVLTAPGGNLSADGALLNGRLLVANADGTLPQYPLPGSDAPPQPSFAAPPWSFGLVQWTGAQAQACAGGRVGRAL